MVKLFVESHGVRSLAVQKEYYKKIIYGFF